MGNDSRRRYFYSIIKKEDIMKFNELCEVLLSNDVYAELKEKEQELLNSFGILNVSLLFDLKRSDLLAQNPEYHYLLTNIDNQEKMLTRLRK